MAMLVKSCSLFVLAIAMLFSLEQAVSGQVDLRLTFTSSADAATFSDHPYSWRLFNDFLVDGLTVVSPGGTTLTDTGFIQIAEFSSFREFQNDVIGTWCVTLIKNSAKIEFDINEFDLALFPPLEIISPRTGDEFFSGQLIPIELAPIDDPSFASGTSVITGGAEIQFVSVTGLHSAIRAILPKGLEATRIRVSRSGSETLPDLITNLRGDVEFFDLRPTLIEVASPRVDLNILANPNLGDINGDGVVSLLDVSPFVNLIIIGEFLFDADINVDGSVDLLDVGPFVELLTGE